MKVLDGFRKIEEILLVITMILILFLIFIQALFRYFFGSGLIWGEELARYLHVAQVWIGGSLAIKKGGHIRVTFVRDLFNKTGRKILDLLSTFLFFSFMVFIAIKGTDYILQLVSSGQRSPSMGISMWIPYTVVPLGGFLMAVRLVQQFISILKGNLLAEKIEGVQE